jgi:hypothetical protein
VKSSIPDRSARQNGLRRNSSVSNLLTDARSKEEISRETAQLNELETEAQDMITGHEDTDPDHISVVPNFLNEDDSIQEEDHKGGRSSNAANQLVKFQEKLNETDDAIDVPWAMEASDRGYYGVYDKGQLVEKPSEPPKAEKALKVGLVFLPGANKAEVNYRELKMMNPSEAPNQQTSEWRAKTAASLLKSHEINEKLELKTNYYNPRREILLLLAKENKRECSEKSLSVHDKANIDSNSVSIVWDFSNHRGEFEMECTLIEVDHHAMVDLIFNFGHEIGQKGGTMENATTLKILDNLIDDAKKLCQRSPALFRTTLRSTIRKSKR